MDYQYIYGPIASRRLGRSLGIAPITNNMCNYSCVYCQLGKINYQPHEGSPSVQTTDILKELDHVFKKPIEADMISIVGDGEPLLHNDLHRIIDHIKANWDGPLAIITNGSRLYDARVMRTLQACDIVCPSLDAYDVESFKRVNRPYKGLSFNKMLQGLIDFSHQYTGKLWLEIMFVERLNTDDHALKAFQSLLKQIKYDRLYLNTPVRPPQQASLKPLSAKRMHTIQQTLGGIPLDYLSHESYQTLEDTPLKAIKSLVKRHPLTLQEIDGLLKQRFQMPLKALLNDIKNDPSLMITAHGPFQMVCYQG